eukprot:TRINITY_DN7221_c0_g2_i1.p1 TRINITY_DN7221_c0_g2~~TRINITY_DN7221_c0_g2_i1.p1  ORF type:complete len:574 (-),score=154.87 TRINITY_DN7221_c0_g2_i1:160-1881(-)
MEAVLQMCDAVEAVLLERAADQSAETFRMLNYALRSEGLLRLGGATEWLQHLSASTVQTVQGHEILHLPASQLGEVVWNILPQRSAGMLHLVMGLEHLLDSRMEPAYNCFFNAAKLTNLAMDLRTTAMEHLFLIQMTQAMANPSAKPMDALSLEGVPSLQLMAGSASALVPCRDISGVLAKMQWAVLGHDSVSFARLHQAAAKHIDCNHPAHAVLRQSFEKLAAQVLPLAEPSGADYSNFTQQDSWRLDRLSAILLSPACCTDKVDAGACAAALTQPMPEQQLMQLLEDSIPGLADLQYFGSTGGVTGKIPEFIFNTYQNGLPMFEKNTRLNQEYIKMLRFIMRKIQEVGPRERRNKLTALAKGFQDCQMVQARTIQSIYEHLLGRNLMKQTLAIVDKLKVDETGVLRRLVYEMHGSNHGAALPHVEAGIIAGIGLELGLPGTTAAMNDAHKRGCNDTRAHARRFRALFQVDELADWIAEDINTVDEEADRYIELDALDKFASDLAKSGNGSSDLALARGMYYDPDNAHVYKSLPKSEAQLEADLFFVHQSVVIDILEQLFVHEGLISIEAFE